MNIEFTKNKISLIAGTLLGDSFMSIDKRYSALSYRMIYQHTNKDYFNFKVSLLNLEGRTGYYKTGYGSLAYRFTSNALTNTNFPINKFYYTGHHKNKGQRKNLTYKTLQNLITLDALSLWIADDGSIRYNNGKKHTPILSIHTQNSNDNQITKYVNLFQKKYRCLARIYKDKRVKTFGNFITFDTRDTLYLLNQLRNKHVKGVEYKYYFPTEGYLLGD